MPISAQELKEYINKLKDGKDITKRDIPKITSYCRLRNAKFDPDLMQAYEEWFKAVANRLPEFGNYAYTVPVCSFLLKNFNLNVIKAVSECLDRMSLLDGAARVEIANMPVADWVMTNTERPTFASILKFAGDLRSSDIYKKISDMVSLFEDNFEEKYGRPEYDLDGSPGINVQTLYVQSILSVAYRKKMPIARITTEDVRRQKKTDIVLVEPSDRKNLEKLLSLTPDEVFDQIFSQNPEFRKISKTTSLKIAVLDSRRIFDETGMMMERYSFLKKKREMAEDDKWLEVIR